jgi:hypothetical protein
VDLHLASSSIIHDHHPIILDPSLSPFVIARFVGFEFDLMTLHCLIFHILPIAQGRASDTRLFGRLKV